MEFGTRKYGTPLQAFNGRNAVQDAYEEVLDLACYLKQMMVEQKVIPTPKRVTLTDDERLADDIENQGQS